MSHNVQSFIAAGSLVLSAGAAMVLAACSQSSATVPAAQAAAPHISAAVVLERPTVEAQEFSGRLEAVERVVIRTRVSGYVAAVKFQPGAEVKRGDVLFVVDQRPYQAEANRAEAAMLAARAKADLARSELARAEKLIAEKAIAQREVDEKTTAMKELEASARAAGAAYEAAKLNLDYTTVRSPIDGRVSKAEVTLGNLVDSNVVLTSVVSSNPIYASFDGDEDTYLRVGALARSGKPVAVRIGLANEAGFPHEGKLEFVDNRVDPATGSVRMRALLKNADGLLAPGLFARVQVAPAGQGSQAILVADRAIGTDQNRKFVYVIKNDGKAEYRAVHLGPVAGGLRVVRDGIKPGEKVIVDGLQRVRPGAPVSAQLVAMDADPNAPAQAPATTEKKADADGGSGNGKAKG